jgi:hypothetical protein
VANRETEKLPAGTTPAEYGQAVTVAGTPSGTYALISMVTSPLTVRNRQDYVVISIPDAATPNVYPTEPDTFRWTVVEDRLVGMTSFDEVQTDYGLFDCTFAAPDTVHVTVELTTNGTTLATLTLNQTVQARRADVDAFITANKLDREDAIHELVSDLRSYIDAAVVASGPNGVPARLIAAILWLEMMMRWREGTDGAERFRKALAEGRALTGPQPSQLEQTFGDDDDLIREVELEAVATGFNVIIGSSFFHRFFAGKSIGVGQLRQFIAAMMLCEVPWREKPPLSPLGGNASERKEIDDEIESDYLALPMSKKVEIYNRLRFPKTNIALVARSLALLKNRPRTSTTCGPTTTTRWPALTRQQMVGQERPCSVIATEFTRGATNSPAAASEIARYGEFAWRSMTNVLPINAAAFFPEPP